MDWLEIKFRQTLQPVTKNKSKFVNRKLLNYRRYLGFFRKIFLFLVDRKTGEHFIIGNQQIWSALELWRYPSWPLQQSCSNNFRTFLIEEFRRLDSVFSRKTTLKTSTIRCWSIQTRCLVACNRFRTKHKVKVKLKFINCSFMFENRFWSKFSSDNFIFCFYTWNLLTARQLLQHLSHC